ncbi:MAG TPA: uroporphyrinogen-III synthase [Pyrinomonadaceae bacterium]|nr:uroporphyrinogen-III synthase [Pyrinomonadaceae bacterium]
MASILVVREFDNFSRILAEKGFSAVNCPTIETAPLEDLSDFEAKLSALETYDGIFLTSAAAAEIFREKLNERNISFGGKVFVLGKRSFEILQNAHLDLFFDEKANTAREMLDLIAPGELGGKRFLFIRGEKSLRVVPEFLAKTAEVDEAIVYQTRKIRVETDKLKTITEKFEKGEIIAACFFSPRGAESFLEQFGAKSLHQTKIAAIGKTTADFFEKQNLTADFVAAKATAEDFAFELVKYLEEYI